MKGSSYLLENWRPLLWLCVLFGTLGVAFYWIITFLTSYRAAVLFLGFFMGGA
jgi:hypothetical protein